MTKKQEKKTDSTYTKEQLIRSAKGVERDILRVILEDGKKYSRSEVEKLKKAFLRRKVVG